MHRIEVAAQLIASRIDDPPSLGELSAAAQFPLSISIESGVNSQRRIKGVFGIPLDDPASVGLLSLRYAACLCVGDVQPVAPFHSTMLPGGTHALLVYRGPYQELEAVAQQLTEWLLFSYRKPANAPLYYRLLNDPEIVSDSELVTEVYLPLLPLCGPSVVMSGAPG